MSTHCWPTYTAVSLPLIATSFQPGSVPGKPLSAGGDDIDVLPEPSPPSMTTAWAGITLRLARPPRIAAMAQTRRILLRCHMG